MLGVYDVYGGSPDAALRAGAQVPVNDPTLVVPAMAAVTEHLGFGVTVATSFEQPYSFARRMSTLDHLTDGRVGWNIVTGYLESGGPQPRARDDHAARAALRHGRRVPRGRVQAVGGLLGGRRGRRRPGPRLVRRPREGPPRSSTTARTTACPGIHLCEPSPQRTPVLYQAGASNRGRTFAATHAEVTSSPSRRRRACVPPSPTFASARALPAATRTT